MGDVVDGSFCAVAYAEHQGCAGSGARFATWLGSEVTLRVYPDNQERTRRAIAAEASASFASASSPP